MAYFFIILLTIFLPFPATAAEDSSQLQDLLGRALEQRADLWECTVQKQYRCSLKHGCSEFNQRAVIRIDLKNNTYARCTDSDDDYIYDECSERSTTPSVSGIYTIFNFRIGVLLKIRNDGEEFLEVVTSGNNTFNEFGSCKAVQAF